MRGSSDNVSCAHSGVAIQYSYVLFDVSLCISESALSFNPCISGDELSVAALVFFFTV